MVLIVCVCVCVCVCVGRGIGVGVGCLFMRGWEFSDGADLIFSVLIRLDKNGWGVRCVIDWVLVGSIVFLGWFVGWFCVIGVAERCVGGVRVLRCEVGREGFKSFTSLNSIRMDAMSQISNCGCCDIFFQVH